jgi:hypothetical protein
MSEIPRKGQQELKKELSDLEHAPPYHSSLPDSKKVELRLKYELTQYSSSQLKCFFENIAVIYQHLSFNQMEKLRISFGPIKEGFFKESKFDKFLKAITSPLFISEHRKAEAYRGTTQINLFSDEFNRRQFLKKSFLVLPKTGGQFDVKHYKVYNCKYDLKHLKLADAILNVYIFIIEVLLPHSVDDEESYKQSLRTIGISDEKSVEKLADVRRDQDKVKIMTELSLKIKTFFRNGMLNKLSVPPKPKAFHQEVFDSLNKNESFMRFLWNTCDECQRSVDHLGLWRTEVRCTECGGECPIFQEPTHSAPAQDSDPIQSLTTELTTATISLGKPAQAIAKRLLEEGVSQLSKLLLLKPSEFESLVQKLQLNTIQVQKLREVSGRQ